jgi:hypothetical protein
VVDLPGGPQGVESLPKGFVADAQATTEDSTGGGFVAEGIEDLGCDLGESIWLGGFWQVGSGEVKGVATQGGDEGSGSLACPVLNVEGA